ncbi:MAG: hypothetical protein ACE10D_05145 [Planctomycetota bacterium]|nr:hypothetical protein [Planctomycetota bacterium]
MRSVLLLAAALFVLVSATDAGIAWEQDFKKAKKKAAAEGKLLFLAFYADW